MLLVCLNAFVLGAHVHVNCAEGSLSVSILRQMRLQCLQFGHIVLLHPKTKELYYTCASSVHKKKKKKNRAHLVP